MSRRIFTLHNFSLQLGDRTYKASVPGDILNDLAKNGIVSDCTEGIRFEECRWVHERNWEYTAAFSADKEILDRPEQKLVFHGIDTLSEIYLNGEFLGQTDNMFLRYEYDVRGKLKEGENSLHIAMFSPWRYLKRHQNDKYVCIFNSDRLALRKAQCHFGWDWAPELPGYGIWQPVELVAGDGYDIEDVYVKTRVNGETTFFVRLSCDGENAEDRRGDYLKIWVERGGARRERVYPVSGKKNLCNFAIEEPELWWPNGYGSQPLYRYGVRLIRNGETLSEACGRFGIREIELVQPPVGDRLGLRFRVNGRTIYCKGSNWVPAKLTTGCIEDERYRRLLDMAAEANFNMLRVWGGGIYEKEVFYDRCDELGILVWQDFMFACSDIPDDKPGFLAALTSEAEQQVVRLRRHPCVALWCAGNERASAFTARENRSGKIAAHYLLRGVVNDLTDAPYVPFGPFSYTDVDNDLTSGDCHQSCYGLIFKRNSAELYRDYIVENGVTAFSSECALMGPGRMRSTRKYMPEELLWPLNQAYEKRYVGNPCEESMRSFAECTARSAELLFGGVASAADYMKKGMLVHAELMRSEIDFLRANGTVNKGFLSWMFNDIWPTGTCSAVDYYFERKPAFYAMKRCFAPVYVSFTKLETGIYLFAVNDTDRPLSGAVTVSQIGLDGKLFHSRRLEVAVGADGFFRCPAEFDECLKDTYLYAELEAGGKSYTSIFFFDLWKDKTFVTDLSYGLRVAPEGYRISITANRFARAVFISLPDGLEYELEDNFFDMRGGDRRELALKTSARLGENNVTVSTYADAWDD